MDSSIHHDTSGSKVRLYKPRNLEETLERRNHFDNAECLDRSIDNDSYENVVIPLKLNAGIERHDRRHFDETSHLKVCADEENCNKMLSGTASEIHFDNCAQNVRYKDNCCHYDVDRNSDAQKSNHQGNQKSNHQGNQKSNHQGNQKSNHQGSPSHHDVHIDEVTTRRKITDLELVNDSFERGSNNSSVFIDVHNDAVDRASFVNSVHCVDVDSDITGRPVNNSNYCTEHNNGAFRSKPPTNSTNCVNVNNDTSKGRLVNNSVFCSEHDDEAAERRSCDVDLDNAAATSRLVDITFSPGDFFLDNDAFERQDSENSSFCIEPERSTLERELADNHIYYELNLATGTILEWRDSTGSSHSADDRLGLGSPGLRATDRGINRDCLICLEKKTTVSRRKCCKFPVCRACLETYYATKVSMAIVQVQCLGNGCNKYVSQGEIMSYLTADLKDRFKRLLVDANRDPRRKTCPRCSFITELYPQTLRERANQKYGLRHLCSVCNLVWCFKCQAPWHEPLSCLDYQRGDRQFKAWTKEQLEGQANAQKCPKCKVYIQRSGGCDHMTCLRCSTDFCYQCGEKYRKMKFIGDHRSQYSILGCKYRYKPNSPVRRRLVRGSIFGGKLLAAPIVGGLALGAGAVVAGLGLVALPFYGGYKLHKMLKQKRKEKEEKAWERDWSEFWDAELEEDTTQYSEDSAEYHPDFSRARSPSFSTFPVYNHFDNHEFDQILANYYGDENDENNLGIYHLATNVDEEREESAECQINLSPLHQSGFEVSNAADCTFNVEATDLNETVVLNSDCLNLSADSKVPDGSYEEDEFPAVVRTGVRLPRRFCRTYIIGSNGLVVKQKNLSSSQDVVTANREVVETCDEVTHL